MRTRRGAAVVGVVAVLGGCTHYNTLYNAERLYSEGERYRTEGRDSLAQARYREVVTKTAAAYRSRPAGEQAGEILFQLGRAHLRAGDPWAARLALEEARRVAADPVLLAEILVYLGSALASLGNDTLALATLGDAVRRGVSGPALARAHLLLGTLILTRGASEVAWDDLERAGGADPAVRVDAGLERVRLSLVLADRERAGYALTRLLEDRDAAGRLDTISGLVSAAARTWGPAAGAALLEGAASSPWPPPARGRMQLERARLLDEAGETDAALREATRVAAGRGEAAAAARLVLARWRLRSSGDLAEISPVRSILLPEEEHPEVADLLDALDALVRYEGIGLDEPLGWFAAAEIARDRLEAPVLARGLYLAYAGSQPAAPWAPKALLAALEMSRGEEDRAWLYGRLEAYRRSPYVLAAFGLPSTGFDALEEELQVRLSEITRR